MATSHSQECPAGTETAGVNAAPTATLTPATVALLYLRAEQVLQLLPISRRCLSNWQRERRIKFYRCGRTILFKRSDIETSLEAYAINPISEPKIRKQRVKTIETAAITTQPPKQKRRMGRITTPDSSTESQL